MSLNIQKAPKKITQSGIYSDIDIEDYHGNIDLFDAMSISSSGLKQFIERPSLYWANSPYNENRIKKDDTKSLNLGQAAHHLLLGEEGFAKKFALRPDTYINDKNEEKPFNARSTWCKIWLADTEAENKRVVTSDDLITLKGMKQSLERHPAIKGGLLNGLVEHSMITKSHGIWLRSRPDNIPLDGADYSDLKTCARLEYGELMRTIYNFGYHIQAAIVRRNAMALTGEFGSFFYVFVETKAPFDCRLVELRPEDMDLGDRQIDLALRYLNICLAKKQWPSYEGFSPSIDPISMPPWAKTKIDTDTDYLRDEVEKMELENKL